MISSQSIIYHTFLPISYPFILFYWFHFYFYICAKIHPLFFFHSQMFLITFNIPGKQQRYFISNKTCCCYFLSHLISQKKTWRTKFFHINIISFFINIFWDFFIMEMQMELYLILNNIYNNKERISFSLACLYVIS